LGNNILDESDVSKHNGLPGFYPQPEELWFSVPIGQDGMEKVNVNWFYIFGSVTQEQLARLNDRDLPFNEQMLSLFVLRSWLETFLARSADTTWRATRDKATRILERLHEPEFTDSDGSAKQLEVYFVKRIAKLIGDFETTFTSENESSNVFSVSRKGTHDSMALMEAADENLPPDTRGRLSVETIRDIRDAGKCLALDCHTACGYHILRAVEHVIIKYVETVTRHVTLKKKPRDWGAYITVLKNHGGDAKVIGNLQHIKDHYRNPIIHPEETLGRDDAFSLFNTSISAIIQLDAAIEAWP
jgi:hypothetical protein